MKIYKNFDSVVSKDERESYKYGYEHWGLYDSKDLLTIFNKIEAVGFNNLSDEDYKKLFKNFAGQIFKTRDDKTCDQCINAIRYFGLELDPPDYKGLAKFLIKLYKNEIKYYD